MAVERGGEAHKPGGGRSGQEETYRTLSGIPVGPVYRPAGEEAAEYQTKLGDPGAFPYTRGVYPTMYRGRLWTMRQYAGYASAEESNRRYRYLLDQGQTGLSVAFDLPTQLGYDSDHALAEGEVGKVGVPISSLADMEQLFEGIPLDRVSTSMTINATAAVVLAMYVATAKRQGVPLDRLSGTVQNDILKEYVARGLFVYPPGPSIRLAVDVIDYCQSSLPKFNSISISGYHIREAGSTAVQEVAFTLAHAVAYVEAVLARGLEVDQFAPRLSFFFNAHSDFLEEVAKFRAARRLWARTMRDRFGAKDPRSWALRFHAQTAGSSLVAQQPLNNVVRTTTQALSAVLGGCQSLHTNALDEALALPSEDTARLALRTQQVIAFESGVAATADPLGGSYYVEALTDRIEADAVDYIRRIDQMGGALKSIEAGFIQREIQDAAYRYQRQVESGDRVIVGVNRFGESSEQPMKLLQVDPAIAEVRRAKLADLRGRRNAAQVRSSLDDLRSAARGTANLMVPIISCVESSATLGEVSDVLRGVFGEYGAGG